MLKIFRIAIVVLSIAAFLLFVALWVRSHRWGDVIQTQKTPHGLLVSSGRGTVSTNSYRLPDPVDVREWQFDSYPLEDAEEYPEPAMLGFRLDRSSANLQFTFPYWFAVLATIILGALAARPWMRFSKRFSLRTLLLAMTLVAIECALIVWMR